MAKLQGWGVGMGIKIKKWKGSLRIPAQSCLSQVCLCENEKSVAPSPLSAPCPLREAARAGWKSNFPWIVLVHDINVCDGSATLYYALCCQQPRENLRAGKKLQIPSHFAAALLVCSGLTCLFLCGSFPISSWLLSEIVNVSCLAFHSVPHPTLSYTFWFPCHLRGNGFPLQPLDLTPTPHFIQSFLGHPVRGLSLLFL